jgi:succinoglycan biosynthesis transport protein ExoP
LSDSPEQVNLDRGLHFLRRRGLWILLCVLLAAGAAFALSKRQTKEYTATAAVVFNENLLSQQIAGLQPAVSNNAVGEQATNVKLLQLGDTATKTAAILGHGQTPEAVKNSVTITAVGTTNVVDVAATSTSPGLAAVIANTYARQYVKQQRRNTKEYVSIALASVEHQLEELTPDQAVGPVGLALEGRAQSLRILDRLQSGDVRLAQAASPPTSPSSPKVARNTIVGAVLGLLIGFAIALLLERLDRRIKEPTDLESIYGLPLLGVIPESDPLSNESSWDDLSAGEAEAFRMVRAQLRYFNVDRDLRTLLVISPSKGDGKTTVSRRLAEAASAMGAATLLVEGDLRAPTLSAQFSIPSGAGLADVLTGAARLEEVVHTLNVGPSTGGIVHRMDVLAAGSMLAPNPAELMESLAMRSLLEQVRATYEFVVIDTAPLTAVSDAFPLLGKADGIVIVGHMRNPADRARSLHETLKKAGGVALGVVANGYKGRGSNSPYAYGYELEDSNS